MYVLDYYLVALALTVAAYKYCQDAIYIFDFLPYTKLQRIIDFDVTNVPFGHENSNEIIVRAPKLIQISLKPLRYPYVNCLN